MENLDKIFGVVLGAIMVGYLVTSAFVPQISGWMTALSDIDGTDWGWVIIVVFLSIVYIWVRAMVKHKKS